MATVEYLSTPNIQRYYFTQYVQARTVTDGATTSSSTTVTSATAAFTSLDVGATISGGSIPGGATISSVTNGTTVVISSSAGITTASGVTLTITRTAANAISGFTTLFNADWSATLGSTAAVVASPSASNTALVIINAGQVLTVAPTQWVGFNYGNWQVLNNSVMGGSQFTPATV